MTTGKTALIMKDSEKGNHSENYGPVTCLPLMRKVLTGSVADKLCEHLENESIIGDEKKNVAEVQEEQKTSFCWTRLKDTRRFEKKIQCNRLAKLYQKAYDLVPHSWSIDAMKINWNG